MRLFLLFFISFLSTSTTSFSEVHKLVQDLKDLSISKNVSLVEVSGAEVILADYDLIRRDFPQTKNMSTNQIDEWLLSQGAFITLEQTKSSVNTKIQTGNQTKPGYRPPGYGRAAVLDTGKNSAYLDIKGNGSIDPKNKKGGHSNGLMTLGEAIREFMVQKMVQKIFDHSGSGFETVANYAVIDWKFDVVHMDSSQSPAGAIYRQAHIRDSHVLRAEGNYWMDESEAIRVERVLRSYGMTSSGENFGPYFDVINVQSSMYGEIVDFGAFLVREQFQRPVLHYQDGLKFLVGEASYRTDAEMAEWIKKSSIFHPEDSKKWVMPDPELRLKFEQWGYSVTNVSDPKMDNLWVWSHELATNLRSGNAKKSDVFTHYQNLVEKISFPDHKKNLHQIPKGMKCFLEILKN